MTMHTITTELEGLERQLETACLSHSELEEISLYDEYIFYKRNYLALYISTLSSGTIAGIIGTGYYKNINYACNLAVTWIYTTDSDNIAQIDRNNIEEVYTLIKECYTGKKEIETD